MKLCLVVSGGSNGNRKVIDLDEHVTLQHLYKVAATEFSFHNISLQHGYPPRPLEESSTTTLKQANIQTMDRIQVLFVDEKKERTNAAAAATETTVTVSQGRSQRASARAATESFAQVIQAQDALVQEQQSKHKSPPNKRKRSSTTTNTTNNLAKLPGGRRLQTGERVGTKKSNKSTTKLLHNKDDVSMALLDAISSESASKTSTVLRATMKSAISQQYSTSRALQKVAAVQSGNYTIQETNGQLLVEYSKGLEGRGMFQEHVDNIPQDALQAVVQAIYSSLHERELLKPTTLAHVSPRVFWSLLYLYPSATSIEETLEELLPNCDWSFLEKRLKTLSVKAQENQRQEEAVDDQDAEAAHEAVQAVEHAMDQLSSYDATQRRERAARAAMARDTIASNSALMTAVGTQESLSSSSWRLETPTEHDDDELKECIDTTIQDEEEVNRILQALHSMNIYNWRQLAIANEPEITNAVQQSKNKVEAWLDYAQAQSVEEMIVQVCDDRVDVVEILRDQARTGTIKDLASWRHMPDLLYASAPSLATLANVDVVDLRKWCLRAQDVLEEYEWVGWYATPVE